MSKKGLDDPVMFHTVQSRYLDKFEDKMKYYHKPDKSRLYIPHTEKDKTKQFWYSSEVKNSHQYPREKKIMPPTFDENIKPHLSMLQKNIDKQPIWVGTKRYTRDTLPHRLQPIWQ